MQFCNSRKWIAIGSILAGGTFAFSLEAKAQMDPEEEQRCVWQCLANSPGAASREYQQCVDAMCVAPRTAPPTAAAPTPRVTWTSGAGKARGSHYAGVEIPGKSFSFICKRGGPGLLAIAGLRGPANAVAIRIDNQDYGLPFIVQNGLFYTNATPHLLNTLMSGKAIQVRNTQTRMDATFPLSGSGSAIRKALAGCEM